MPNLKAKHLGLSEMYLLYQKNDGHFNVSISSNNTVNLNFDTQYLWNTRSDLHEVFCYLFVSWCLPPPPPSDHKVIACINLIILIDFKLLLYFNIIQFTK